MNRKQCPVFWGSHACDLGPHSDGLHKCFDEEPCSEFDEPAMLVRFMALNLDGTETWGEWVPGEIHYLKGVK